MGKLKKKFKKKVNPEKSNKMIIAVVVGVVILFTAIFFITTGEKAPTDKKELISNTLSYLKKSGGILDTLIFPDENRVIIVCNSYIKDIDYNTVAKFAGLKLSNKIKNVEIEVILSKDKKENETHVFTTKNGRLISEKRLHPSSK